MAASQRRWAAVAIIVILVWLAHENTTTVTSTWASAVPSAGAGSGLVMPGTVSAQQQHSLAAPAKSGGLQQQQPPPPPAASASSSAIVEAATAAAAPAAAVTASTHAALVMVSPPPSPPPVCTSLSCAGRFQEVEPQWADLKFQPNIDWKAGGVRGDCVAGELEYIMPKYCSPIERKGNWPSEQRLNQIDVHTAGKPTAMLSEIIELMPNRTLLLMGDSVMEQFYNTLQCFLRKERLVVPNDVRCRSSRPSCSSPSRRQQYPPRACLPRELALHF